MKAAVYRAPGELELAKLPVPSPGPTEALVEVAYCGICGTDLHNVLDGWGVRDNVGGHEWSGRVIEVGDSVDLEIGQLVIGGPDLGCGYCPPCRAGRNNLCQDRGAIGTEDVQGAFAEYVAMDSGKLIPISDDLDPRLAAYAEPLAVSLHAVTTSEISAGDRALVFGCGPIGAGITAVLAERGHEVTVVEPGAARQELAKRLGARIIEPDSLETSWYPGDIPDDAADIVFEASGVKAAFEAGLGRLQRGGRLVLVGNGLDYPTLDTNRMILNELVVTGAFTYDATGFEDAIELIGSGSLPLEALIEPEARPLDELLDTMRELRAGSIAGKVMVQP